jgi:ubiquinone/menaquinone biosynthesis C-methylase UbiE
VKVRGRDSTRAPQLAYSEIQQLTHDEPKRRRKAAKIRAVLQHFFGTDDLTGLTAVDVGCSTGFTAAELSAAGATVIGLDIDVPGLGHAAQRFGDQVGFLCADGTAMPFADQSVDIVVFNHIYEHVVDPDGILAEIRRVLRPNGAAYLGFANRLGIMEPHYRLPFLSWLPRPLADRYVAMSGRADNYYEQFRTRPGLRKMCAGLQLWDYTYTVLSDSAAFEARDMVPPRLANIPPAAWRLLSPIMPTFIWIGTPGSARPQGKRMRHSPDHLKGRSVSPTP